MKIDCGPVGSAGIGISISPLADINLPRAVEILGHRFIREPHLGDAFPAKPAVELGVLLPKPRLGRIDQISIAIERGEPQIIALLELLSQKRLLELERKREDLPFLVAIDLDLMAEGQRLALGAASGRRAG